jgi:hypothetical protein
MPNQLEKIIKVAYKKWKSEHLKADSVHPDEETWACFLEGRLTQEENERIKTHLISCDSCAEVLVTQVRLKPQPVKGLPEELLERVKNLVGAEDKLSVVEIVIMLKEKALEILSTTGDVLVGQEFVPAPVLRSRQLKEFKDEVTILKDFKDIRVEVKIENKQAQAFDLIVFVKDKQTQRIIKDLRVTLLKDDLELESYLTTSDKVIFEHTLAGKYIVEISNIENKIASILLDIRK